MDRKELLKEYKRFKKQFQDSGINRDAFRQMAQKFLPEQQRTTSFIDRLFNAFDADRSGTIDFQEFMLAMSLCSSDNPEDKLRFCFKSLDTDNNGWLDRDEVIYAVELIFKHNPGLENKVAADVNTPQKVRVPRLGQRSIFPFSPSCCLRIGLFSRSLVNSCSCNIFLFVIFFVAWPFVDASSPRSTKSRFGYLLTPSSMSPSSSGLQSHLSAHFDEIFITFGTSLTLKVFLLLPSFLGCLSSHIFPLEFSFNE